MTVEFDPRCSTAQPEDIVRMYIPVSGNEGSGRELHSQQQSQPQATSGESSGDERSAHPSYIPILEKHGGHENWPTKALILPG